MAVHKAYLTELKEAVVLLVTWPVLPLQGTFARMFVFLFVGVCMYVF